MRKVKVRLLSKSRYLGVDHKENDVIEVDKQTADKWVDKGRATTDLKPKVKSVEK